MLTAVTPLEATNVSVHWATQEMVLCVMVGVSVLIGTLGN